VSVTARPIGFASSSLSSAFHYCIDLYFSPIISCWSVLCIDYTGGVCGTERRIRVVKLFDSNDASFISGSTVHVIDRQKTDSNQAGTQ